EIADDFRKRLAKQETGDTEQDGSAANADAAEAAANGEGAANGQESENSDWLLGPKAVNAGSLHCDLGRGHAVDLAGHDHIAIYPVGGWWKSHLGKGRASDKARYALAVSLVVEGDGADIYTEI